MSQNISFVHNREPNRNHVTALTSILEQCQGEVDICMPFVSSQGVRTLIGILDRRAYKNSALAVRFLLCDRAESYQSGHVDLDALTAFSDRYSVEYRAYGDGLHAKLVVADRCAALLTSANLTSGGLSSNLEMGVVIRERLVVTAICDEFDRAWRDADELSHDDIAERSLWCIQNRVTAAVPAGTFATKVPWRPLTTGGRTAAGTDFFAGFEDRDFELLDPATYEGSFADQPIKPAVVQSIQQAIAGPIQSRLNRFYLAIQDHLPTREGLHRHFAARARVRNFYPSDSWVALGRDPTRYIPLAQLAVGIFVNTEGAGVFVNFNIGEEYAPNEDKPNLLRWMRNSPNELLELLANLDPAYEVRFCERRTEVRQPARTFGQVDIDRILQIPAEENLDLRIQRFYSWSEDREILQRPTVVRAVAEQFRILYPIYRKVQAW